MGVKPANAASPPRLLETKVHRFLRWTSGERFAIVGTEEEGFGYVYVETPRQGTVLVATVW